MIGGDATEESIEEGAVFFFRIFLHSGKVEKSQGQKIRDTFGPFSAGTVSQIALCVQRVLKAAPTLREMLSPYDTINTTPPAPTDTKDAPAHLNLNSRAFGVDIRFNPVSQEGADTPQLPDGYADEFTQILSLPNGDVTENGTDPAPPVEPQAKSRFPPFWLLDQLKKLFIVEEAREKCGTVINMLSGPEGDELVAETLFDCLGDSGIELVHTLVQYR